MIVKTPVSPRIGLFSLRAIPEISQRRECPVDRLSTGQEAPLNANRIRSQRQADTSDADWRPFPRVIRDEAIGRIELLQEILERVLLQPM